ncbi:PLDc N-terminal domain-containing protein [Cellulomonas sp. ATA003]|uniref:PLDc N-terminal domain-containing protein n=1 Tax=Cellulomonas sp. ATA003 TaxID=3073064 RepID=UPI00287377C7|nr:PLDc N-terminal domain-containing protein [Cellulomonas sp. ATA003]WNB85933.1 PLDc N-terminal domain-containing protein [Cellulomonas sp. ATA003]
MRNLLFVVLIGLVVYSIIDVVRSEADERWGISKALWILLIVLLPVLGAIAWLVARSQARARGAGGGGGGGGTRPRPSGPRPRRPSGPVAPDDDPEFLWRLERMQRRADAAGRSTDGVPPQPDSSADGPVTGPADSEDDSPGTTPRATARRAPQRRLTLPGSGARRSAAASATPAPASATTQAASARP